MFNINEFRSALKYGGARTSLFEVRITNPVFGGADRVSPFMVKAAQLPSFNLNQIEVFHFGRSIKVPANHTYEDWTTTIINDEDFSVRNAIEAWSNMINGPETNIRKLPTSEQSQYKSIADVTQFSQTGQPLRSYRFIGIWPTNISSIELDWGNEAVQEFQVTWAYDYWVVGDSITGDAGGV